MKHIIIIEDEDMAARHLKKLVLEVISNASIDVCLQSIEESVEYLEGMWPSDSNGHAADGKPLPDLIFMDIHLADGSAFRIFDSVSIRCPIIFTTAYDQYALDAFRAGGLDYLLKPIDRDDLANSISKLERLSTSEQQAAIQQVATTMGHFPSHFLIPLRDKLVPIGVEEIACFYLEDKITYVLLTDGRHFIMERPLDALMEQLNPRLFFRANRQYIVAHSAIKEIALWPISKLALTMVVPTPERIIISKAKVNEFKQWYTY